MDLRLLDTNMIETHIVDVFESVIWTERYNDAGDVTLVVPSNVKNRVIFVEGKFLRITGTDEVMLIETVSDKDNQLTIVGQSLVGFLKQRIFRDTWSTAKDSWNINDTASNLAFTIVYQMCVAPSGIMGGPNTVLPSGLGTSELISNLSLAVAIPSNTYNVALPYGNVFDAVKTVCDLDSLGFRIRLKGYSAGVAQLEFLTYSGLDRTTTQSANAPVLFDTALDTFSGVETLRSIAGYKTHAYAWASGMTAQSSMGIAVAPGAAGVSNWQRRTLMVTADDVNAADYSAAALKQILDQKARDALANNNYVRMTDGTLVPQSTYKYGFEYGLGDIIELRGPTSVAQSARITEYIRAQDTTGERSYPTLSVIS